METTNVIQMIEPAPEGFNVSREAWSATPAVLREEISRMHREMSEAIPIAKDRAAGRKSRRPGGFWELHCCERDRHMERAAELRELLAPAIAKHFEYDALASFFETAQAAGIGRGMTLPAYMQSRIGLEEAIRRDPVEGVFKVVEMLGLDPHEFAEQVLAADAA